MHEQRIFIKKESDTFGKLKIIVTFAAQILGDCYKLVLYSNIFEHEKTIIIIAFGHLAFSDAGIRSVAHAPDGWYSIL